MGRIVVYLLNWSEVWALLIPILILYFKKKQPGYLRPIIIYLWVSLILNIGIDLGYNYSKYVPNWLYPNNYIYNILSIVRFICFSSFFILLEQPFLFKLKKTLPILSFVFIVINFLFFEKFYNPLMFSSRLFALEAGILIFYCLQYYLYSIHEESISSKKEPSFWVVTGLSIYVIFNFLYFLFYDSLVINKQEFAVYMWHYHNISFIILCIFIAKAFYVIPSN